MNLATDKQIILIKSLLKLSDKDTIDYINKIINQKIQKLKDLTRSDITHIFNYIQQNETTFIYQKINTKNLYYHKHKEEYDFVIATQTKIKDDDYKLFIFKNILVIDWDDLNLKQIHDLCSKLPYTFYIYKTFKGYHGYIMSDNFDPKNNSCLEFLKSLKCDEIYISFVRIVGFAVRLQKKKNRNELFVEKFIEKINGFPIIPRSKYLLNLKDSLLEK